ncbi:unnamed protein product [Larinioides sclopetarius]|uniref:Uncharacterized protein n=1 Tax=Larinioides sclopetarius TaxID=280406 RepID=A0AAV2A6Y9_9ARAC
MATPPLSVAKPPRQAARQPSASFREWPRTVLRLRHLCVCACAPLSIDQFPYSRHQHGRSVPPWINIKGHRMCISERA